MRKSGLHCHRPSGGLSGAAAAWRRKGLFRRLQADPARRLLYDALRHRQGDRYGGAAHHVRPFRCVRVQDRPFQHRRGRSVYGRCVRRPGICAAAARSVVALPDRFDGLWRRLGRDPRHFQGLLKRQRGHHGHHVQLDRPVWLQHDHVRPRHGPDVQRQAVEDLRRHG